MARPEDDSSRSLVGIVIVSHSRALARVAVALAAEMLHGRPVRIAVAAGLDDVTLGTDAVRIKEAIQKVDSRGRRRADGPRQREGLVVAAVAAAGGAGRKEVAAEAHNALMGKAAHLSNPRHLAAHAATTLASYFGARQARGLTTRGFRARFNARRA